MHEDLGPASVTDLPQGSNNRGEIQSATSRQLQQFLLLWQLLVAAHPILPGIEVDEAPIQVCD